MDTQDAKQLLGAIRRHCMECSGHSLKAVQRCPMKGCDLWPYRTAEAAPARRPRDQTDQVDFLTMLTGT